MPNIAEGQDPEGVGTIDPQGRYVPAPPVVADGEPPLADNWDQPATPADLSPGEPGYIQPN